MVLQLQLPSSGQCPLSSEGHHFHGVAQKTFKRLLLRVRGSNSFQFSRMHLKGVYWEMDWLFPIWKTVMTGRKRKKKKEKQKTPNRPPSILWVDFLMGESFWSLSYPILLKPESQASPGQGIDLQAGWDMTASWRWTIQAGWGRSASWELCAWAVEACWPGTPGLADPQAGWGVTTFDPGDRVLIVGISNWLKNKFIRGNRPYVPWKWSGDLTRGFVLTFRRSVVRVWTQTPCRAISQSGKHYPWKSSCPWRDANRWTSSRPEVPVRHTAVPCVPVTHPRGFPERCCCCTCCRKHRRWRPEYLEGSDIIQYFPLKGQIFSGCTSRRL